MQTFIQVNPKVKVRVTVEFPISAQMIRKHICEYFSATWDEVVSGNKRRELVTARWLYAFMCKKYMPDKTVESIADDLAFYLNNAYLAIRRVEELLSVEDQYMLDAVTNIEVLIFKEILL